jgi:hypothetical protein
MVEVGVSLQRQTKTTYQIQFYALKCMPRVYFYCGLLTTNKKRLHLKSLNTIWYCLGRRREMRCQPFSC